MVGPAARVDQALAMIKAEAIDAAVLDVNLNGQTSYPVADALATRGVPFVSPSCSVQIVRPCARQRRRLTV